MLSEYKKFIENFKSGDFKKKNKLELTHEPRNFEHHFTLKDDKEEEGLSAVKQLEDLAKEQQDKLHLDLPNVDLKKSNIDLMKEANLTFNQSLNLLQPKGSEFKLRPQLDVIGMPTLESGQMSTVGMSKKKYYPRWKKPRI